MNKGILITGTDTGCGKTYVSWLLVRELRKAEVDAVGWKPVCCGDREDAYALEDASDGLLSVDEINPVWFRTPIAPFPAAELEGGGLDLDDLASKGEALRQKHVVLGEGVGGWEVPMTAEADFSDFAKALDWPIILVVGNKLGALSHALLTARAIEAKGGRLVAVVLNQVQEEQDVAGVTNGGVLRQRFGDLYAGEVMHGAEVIEPDVLAILRARLAV
ncbi:MAG: dethiobiotin synthase [Verrucomicrobiota bacterium JB023]|nr:dethiobiotin synthase [Verrucomicrobiota bacterium JB023]